MIEARTGPQVDEVIVQATLDAWSESGRVSTLRVEGASMQPLVNPGDSVDVLHGAAGVRVGDVVAFRGDGRLVLHRVLRLVGRDAVQTAGDNRSLVDAPVARDSVVGRVVVLATARGRKSLDGRVARILGRLVAASLRLRRGRVAGRMARLLYWLIAAVLRP